MKCAHVQDELLLFFGREDLPDRIQEHLDSCAECRAFWAQLGAESELLPADEAFFPTEEEKGAALRGVNIRLVTASSEVRRGFFESLLARLRRGRLAPALASLVVLLTTAWIGHMSGRLVVSTEPSTADVSVVLADAASSEDTEELDADMVDVLLYDFSAAQAYKSGELLLDDLTEEELLYLESNFDVGDIL